MWARIRARSRALVRGRFPPHVRGRTKPKPKPNPIPIPIPKPNQVIAWLRVREFQLLSLRMICHQMLRAHP